MSIKSQLIEAKNLIKQKRYHEARYVLSNIDDHPIAIEWLTKLDKLIEPASTTLQADEWEKLVKANATKRKNHPVPKPKKATQNGLNMQLVAIVAVVLIIVGAGVVYVFLNPNLSPILLDDTTGCGAQDWYNNHEGVIASIIYHNPWDIIDIIDSPNTIGVTVRRGPANNRRRYLEEHLQSIQATPPPACIASAGATLQNALQAQTRVIDYLAADNANQAFHNIGVSVDNAEIAFNELLTVGVRFRGNDARAIEQLTDPACPALDWAIKVMYSEIHFFVLVLNTDDLLKADNMEAAILSFSADFSQEEVNLKYNIITPTCMQEAREHLLNTIGSYRSVVDAVRGNPIDFETRVIPYYEDRLMQSLTAFFSELKQAGLDTNQFGDGGSYHFTLN